MKTFAAIFLSVLTLAFETSARPEVTVMTFNCWHRLTKVNEGVSKAAEAIARSGADVVGLQECTADVAGKLAARLGWHLASGGDQDVQIISRLPVTHSYPVPTADPARAIGARIRLASGGEIIFFNAHLTADHYGPYAAFAAGASPETVLAEEEKSNRVGQIAAVLKAMADHLARADITPVFLVGDFNVPSHRDWTADAAAAHGGVGPVAWPVTRRVEATGLRDAFRVLHPDPVTTPGNSWSTLQKGSEPQDRIDFIFYRGTGVHPVSTTLYAAAVETTIGAWGDDTGPVINNTWPSDHFAVRAKFRLRVAEGGASPR